MTLPDFRLIRLLPLASLVLTACTLNAPKGLAKVRTPRSGVSTSRKYVRCTSIRRAARLPTFPNSRRSMPASSGSKPVRITIVCC